MQLVLVGLMSMAVLAMWLPASFSHGPLLKNKPSRIYHGPNHGGGGEGRGRDGLCGGDPCSKYGPEYKCRPLGTYGYYCEYVIFSDACSPNPCQNGGKCENFFGIAICNCHPDYFGMFCEHSLYVSDPCSPNPCQNGGYCFDSFGQAECICQLDYTGTYCESSVSTGPVSDPCSPTPCQNGGYCFDNYGQAVCICQLEYTGTYCESSVSTGPDPCTPNPCQHGGTCLNVNGQAKCTCTSAYMGTYCDTSVTPAPSPSEPNVPATTAWPLIGGASCSAMNNLYAGLDGQLSGFFTNNPNCGDSPITSRANLFRNFLEDYSRIVGGEFPIKGAWPWHVMIGPKSVGPVCGASLLNSEWVLTAAHCVDLKASDVAGSSVDGVFSPAPNLKPCQWNLRLGTPDHAITPDQDTVDVTASKIFFHKDYSFTTNTNNDVALVKLEKPITFTDRIKTICLPNKGDKFVPGDICYIMGYGENNIQSVEDLGTSTGQTDLKFRQLKLQIADCGVTGTDSAQFVCTVSGQYGQSPCRGDSGGSLVCRRGNRWYQAGFASTVADCGYDPNTLNYYTSAEHYLEWINSVMSIN